MEGRVVGVNLEMFQRLVGSEGPQGPEDGETLFGRRLVSLGVNDRVVPEAEGSSVAVRGGLEQGASYLVVARVAVDRVGEARRCNCQDWR